MNEKMIKWGFIGCGEVTKTKSGPAFQKVEHSEVVAVMSRDGAKAKAYAKERGIKKWYDDAQELIDDPEVNAIYIATPPSSHATYAIMAMKAGKPAYIEKPMAVTYEECTRINRISQETGVPCFVAYYRRYLPYFQKVKEMVENGSIGNVINVQVRFAQPPRDLDYNRENLPWRVQADIAGGGYFYDLAPHQIDLLQDMFGCILEASGGGQFIVTTPYHGYLKNLTIDYNFPKELVNKIGLQALKIYVSGENLLTFSPLKKYAKNYDPEGIYAGDADYGTNKFGSDNFGDGDGYPVMKSYTIGLSITF